MWIAQRTRQFDLKPVRFTCLLSSFSFFFLLAPFSSPLWVCFCFSPVFYFPLSSLSSFLCFQNWNICTEHSQSPIFYYKHSHIRLFLFLSLLQWSILFYSFLDDRLVGWLVFCSGIVIHSLTVHIICNLTYVLSTGHRNIELCIIGMN